MYKHLNQWYFRTQEVTRRTSVKKFFRNSIVRDQFFFFRSSAFLMILVPSEIYLSVSPAVNIVYRSALDAPSNKLQSPYFCKCDSKWRASSVTIIWRNIQISSFFLRFLILNFSPYVGICS